MWKSCLYGCGPYTFTCSILLFILFGMLQNGSWTFEVLAAKHRWDVKQKARCCRNAAIFYLCVSLLLMLLAAVDAFLIDLSSLCHTPSRRLLAGRIRRNGFRATMAASCHRLAERFRRCFKGPRGGGTLGHAHDANIDMSTVAMDGVSQTSSFSGQPVLRFLEMEETHRQRADLPFPRLGRPGSPTSTLEGSPASLGFVASPHSPAVARTASLLFQNASLSSSPPPLSSVTAAGAVGAQFPAAPPTATVEPRSPVSGPPPPPQPQQQEASPPPALPDLWSGK